MKDKWVMLMPAVVIVVGVLLLWRFMDFAYAMGYTVGRLTCR